MNLLNSITFSKLLILMIFVIDKYWLDSTSLEHTEFVKRFAHAPPMKNIRFIRVSFGSAINKDLITFLCNIPADHIFENVELLSLNLELTAIPPEYFPAVLSLCQKWTKYLYFSHKVLTGDQMTDIFASSGERITKLSFFKSSFMSMCDFKLDASKKYTINECDLSKILIATEHQELECMAQQFLNTNLITSIEYLTMAKGELATIKRIFKGLHELAFDFI